MKPIFLVLFYVFIAILVLKIHQFSPTNMAGFGFDVVVYLFAFVASIGILVKNVFNPAHITQRLRILNICGSFTVLCITLYTVSR